MKPTIKVSIGGFAFNLEEDAYNLLKDYLDSLKRHFQGNPESGEIIADIEFRMSELLQMRMKNADNAVSLDDAEEIMKIMGNPKDFGDVNPENSEEGLGQGEAGIDADAESFRKRRLFRDVENKVIGGVCSGLGHYFRIDAVVVRLIFAGLFLILFFSMNHTPSCMSVVLIYAVLWLVMPAAKTFNQKLWMGGRNPSIENIEDRSQPIQPVYRGSGVGSFLKVLVNVILGILIFVMSVTIIGSILALVWLYVDENLLGAVNYLILAGYNTIYAKVSLLLLMFLPMIGLLCLLIKLFRRSNFTTQTLVSFIVGVVLWVGAFVYLGNKSFASIYQQQHRETASKRYELDSPSDTLYVKLGEGYQDAELLPNVSSIFYKGDKVSERKVFIMPQVRIYEDSTATRFSMEIEKVSGGKGSYDAKRNVEKMNLEYTLTDSLLLIKPEWHDNENPWKYVTYRVNITAPVGKKVILEKPLDERNYFYY